MSHRRSFASLTTFLQGTVTTFQVIPNPTELGWRSLFGAWYLMDTVRLRSNINLELGVRHEFTNGWNEVAGRAANFVPDAQGVLVTAPRVGNSLFTENNAKKLFGPRIGLASLSTRIQLRQPSANWRMPVIPIL